MMKYGFSCSAICRLQRRFAGCVVKYRIVVATLRGSRILDWSSSSSRHVIVSCRQVCHRAPDLILSLDTNLARQQIQHHQAPRSVSLQDFISFCSFGSWLTSVSIRELLSQPETRLGDLISFHPVIGSLQPRSARSSHTPQDLLWAKSFDTRFDPAEPTGTEL